MFKKRNTLSKLWLKYTDRAGYKEYKWSLENYRKDQLPNFLLGHDRLSNYHKIKKLNEHKQELNFLHSGNAGDIIYALATIKKVQELTAARCNLYFRLGQPLKLRHYKTHPMGTVMLNQKMAEMLFPLIQPQCYITRCEIYADQKIDIDLDYFRSGLVPLDKGNIARWCGYITGVTPELWKPWLKVEPETQYADSIILARSMRYRNILASYKFLNKYPNLKFIGIEEEFKDMKKHIPHLEWVPVNDFSQMASIIAGCKFFIGNQSFPFSIAEALKVPRILEISFEVINVVPEGEKAYDFLFQDHFESLVEELYQS
jgi:hypothetical protein